MSMNRVLVGGEWRAPNAPDGSFHAFDPETGAALPPEFPVSRWEELDGMVRAGLRAAEALESVPAAARSRFFEQYAAAIERHAADLAATAHAETALPAAPRLLDVEIPRTVRQLRMAAAVVAGDLWRHREIDTAAGLMSEYRSLGGPVLVIGPNNFPFAFNAISGGDFAAALAAGNPVIAKGHPGHPETTRRLAELCAEAARDAGLPAAAVQLFYHCLPDTGLRLAGHAGLAAVAFTGSRAAGLSLKAAADAAGTPFYGEMSASNPVFLLPSAVAARAADLARELFGSFTLGCGQFCTKPALAVLVGDDAGRQMLGELMALVSASASVVLLGAGVRDAFHRGIAGALEAGARRLARGRVTRTAGFAAEPELLEVDAETFLRAPAAFQIEAFGPTTLIVSAGDEGELLAVARGIEGTLAASVYVASGTSDEAIYRRLAPVLVRRSGRFMTNKMPTGVAVSPAMNHGGPFPATTHPGFTAVGMPRSLLRFAALKCFDSVEERMIPE